MKSLLLSGMAGLMVLGIGSCEQIKDKIFQAFSANGADVNFIIPVVGSTTVETVIGVKQTYLNIDSLIREETGNAYNLSSVNSIKLESCILTLLNPDPINNFSNFETGRLVFNTDTKSDPLEIATGVNPDVYSVSWTLPNIPDTELKPYLSGTTVYYVLWAKARRITTKSLNCRMTIKFRIE